MFNLDTYILDRVNTESLWHNTDSEENYIPNNSPYKPNDFSYKFNDYGFRCDNFNQENEIPIVFMGCSITEGVGLPLEQTWSSLLLSKIRQRTNKNIPYWSLALGGSSVDTQARMLYWFNKMHKVKFIFALFPNLYRREYCLYIHHAQIWGLAFGQRPELNKIFSDPYFRYYESMRSFMIIDSIVKESNIKICSSIWKGGKDVEEDEIITNFPNLNFYPTPTITSKDKCARDNRHPGSLYHTEVASIFWNKINHHF
jgi:hypothetical protein